MLNVEKNENLLPLLVNASPIREVVDIERQRRHIADVANGCGFTDVILKTEFTTALNKLDKIVVNAIR